jgi:hypothetical protein
MGVWQRSGLTRLVPILIFVRAPRYSKRFNFYDSGARVSNGVFPTLFDIELRRATASLRPLAVAA